MTPKAINELNRKFYHLDTKPSFWHEHGFAVLLWAAGIMWSVYFLLRVYQIWLGGQACLGYPVWLGHFWLNMC